MRLVGELVRFDNGICHVKAADEGMVNVKVRGVVPDTKFAEFEGTVRTPDTLEEDSHVPISSSVGERAPEAGEEAGTRGHQPPPMHETRALQPCCPRTGGAWGGVRGRSAQPTRSASLFWLQTWQTTTSSANSSTASSTGSCSSDPGPASVPFPAARQQAAAWAAVCLQPP